MKDPLFLVGLALILILAVFSVVVLAATVMDWSTRRRMCRKERLGYYCFHRPGECGGRR